MTTLDAIELIKIAKAEIEWEYPLDYQIAFDEAIKALEEKLTLAEKVQELEQTEKAIEEKIKSQNKVNIEVGKRLADYEKRIDQLENEVSCLRRRSI